jgi:hypothetical protein
MTLIKMIEIEQPYHQSNDDPLLPDFSETEMRYEILFKLNKEWRRQKYGKKSKKEKEQIK